MIWFIIPFGIMLLVGVPIAYCLGGSAAIFFFATGSRPMEAIAQQMYTAADCFPLMAVPFFLLAGELFHRSGLTERLMAFTVIIIGRLRGGLAYASILACAILAAIIGSAVATTAAVGGVSIPAMKKEGYDLEFSAAVAAAGGTLGPIIPPSIAFIIAGAVFNVSIGALFIAGVIPGLMLTAAFMAVVWFRSRQRQYPKYTGKFSFKESLVCFRESLVALIMPIIIMGGIIGGVFTPTEAGAIAAAYVLVVGVFYLRTLTPKVIMDSLIRSGILSCVILIIVAAANPFGWVLSVNMVPQTVANLLTSLTENELILYYLVDGLLIVAGMFIETGANILMLGPVLIETVTALGANILWFVALMCIALTLGMITPPVCVTIYVAARVAGISFEQIIKEVLPFAIAGFAVVALITAFPELVLFLPRALGFGG